MAPPTPPPTNYTLDGSPLTHLPSETLHTIFSLLPLRQIFLSRSLSKFFNQTLTSQHFISLLTSTKPPLHLIAIRPRHHHQQQKHHLQLHARENDCLHVYDPMGEDKWVRLSFGFLPFKNVVAVAGSTTGVVYCWGEANEARKELVSVEKGSVMSSVESMAREEGDSLGERELGTIMKEVEMREYCCGNLNDARNDLSRNELMSGELVARKEEDVNVEEDVGMEDVVSVKKEELVTVMEEVETRDSNEAKSELRGISRKEKEGDGLGGGNLVTIMKEIESVEEAVLSMMSDSTVNESGSKESKPATNELMKSMASLGDSSSEPLELKNSVSGIGVDGISNSVLMKNKLYYGANSMETASSSVVNKSADRVVSNWQQESDGSNSEAYMASKSVVSSKAVESLANLGTKSMGIASSSVVNEPNSVAKSGVNESSNSLVNSFNFVARSAYKMRSGVIDFTNSGLKGTNSMPHSGGPNKLLVICNPISRKFAVLPQLGSAWAKHGTILVGTGNRVLVLTELAVLYLSGFGSWCKFSSNLASKPRSPVLVGDTVFALCDAGSPWRNQWKLYSCRLPEDERLNGWSWNWSRLEKEKWGEICNTLKRPRLIRGEGNQLLMVGGLKTSYSLDASYSTILILKLDLKTLEWEEVSRMPSEMFLELKESGKFKVFGGGSRVCFSGKKVKKLAMWESDSTLAQWRWIDGAPGYSDGLVRGFFFEARLATSLDLS